SHFLSSLYWLLLIPYKFHGIPLGSGAGWIALSAYAALYPAIWVWLSWKIFSRTPIGSSEFISAPRWKRARWAFICAVIWVALEMMRGRFLTGYPWNFVGASQY